MVMMIIKLSVRRTRCACKLCNQPNYYSV